MSVCNRLAHAVVSQWRNCVGNACVFTPEGSYWLRLEGTADSCRVQKEEIDSEQIKNTIGEIAVNEKRCSLHHERADMSSEGIPVRCRGSPMPDEGQSTSTAIPPGTADGGARIDVP
jgi:hypothetical protein